MPIFFTINFLHIVTANCINIFCIILAFIRICLIPLKLYSKNLMTSCPGTQRSCVRWFSLGVGRRYMTGSPAHSSTTQVQYLRNNVLRTDVLQAVYIFRVWEKHFRNEDDVARLVSPVPLVERVSRHQSCRERLRRRKQNIYYVQATLTARMTWQQFKRSPGAPLSTIIVQNMFTKALRAEISYETML